MYAKDLQRYGRLLIEKRKELLTAAAVIPAAGRVEGDPVEQATAEAEAELKIGLHRIFCGLVVAPTRSRTRSATHSFIF